MKKKEMSFVRFFDEFGNIPVYHTGIIDQIIASSNKKFIVTKSVGMGKSYFYKLYKQFLKK